MQGKNDAIWGHELPSRNTPLGRSREDFSRCALRCRCIQQGNMSEHRVAYPYPSTTIEDIRMTAERLGLPFNECQLMRMHKAVLSIEDSAARLRQGLHRNDE